MANRIPDRPEISSYAARKSHSAADIFNANNGDCREVKFRKDGERTEKTIIFESNYDYHPERRDELKLKRGSTIRMIQRDCDEGWWYGETMDGKKGYFPQNHVQLAKSRAKEIRVEELKFTGCLGSGGFSFVKSAIYKNKEVAVKIPHSTHSADKILEVVREEASIFQMLNHVNIVEMYGVVVGDELGLVLELCRDTLSNICSNSKNISLSEEIICYWGSQIAQGMKYLHDLNVLHRDLKAANVLIKEKVCECLLNGRSNSFDQLLLAFESNSGFCNKCGGAALNKLTLKIADLGLSKKLQVAHSRRSFVGTVAYLAPEVIRDHDCSKAMDVWSFGVVLWEVLTGSVPFAGLERCAILLKVGEFSKLEIPAYCPRNLSRIISMCWSDDAEQRPTFKQLVSELEKSCENFKSMNFHDQAFIEKSINTLRRNIKEMQVIANEMTKTAQELQKREENVKKSEKELELNRMMFELQQVLLKGTPKDKPQPPKRMTRLKCTDISEPFGCKTEISLTKNFKLIKSATNLESSDSSDAIKNTKKLASKEGMERLLSGFATMPRSQKKPIVEQLTNDYLCSLPMVPSKSQPDLLNFCRTPLHSASTSSNGSSANHELQRSNARRVKKDRLTTSTDENIDDKCIVVINDVDLENLLKDEESPNINLDHLATPSRSSVPLVEATLRPRASSELCDYPTKSKKNDGGKRFFKRIFRHKEKHNKVESPVLPRSLIAPIPLGASVAGSSILSTPISPSRDQYPEKSSSSKKSTMKTKKKNKVSDTDAKRAEALMSIENSKAANPSDHRQDFAASVVNSLRSASTSSPVRSSLDDTIGIKPGPYERLSGQPNSTFLENVSYVHLSRERASTSDVSLLSSCIRPASEQMQEGVTSGNSCDDVTNRSALGIIENFFYKPPSNLKLCSASNSVLDSPVEGGLDDSESSTLAVYPTEGDGRVGRSPLTPSKRNIVPPSVIYIGNALQTDVSTSKSPSDVLLTEVPSSPPYVIAPAPPLSQNVPYLYLPSFSVNAPPTVSQPQRPYTLDLNKSVTPTESGISTADSSSLSNIDCAPTDHAPPLPFESVAREAPPIPPRTVARKSIDSNRGAHYTVSQSPR